MSNTSLRRERSRQKKVQVLVLPVLRQFQYDVSSCGEDNEGHPQHGAANTQLF